MRNMLSSRQFEVLTTLWESDHPLLVSEIVERSLIHTSTVQLALKKLIKIKYVAEAEVIHSKKVLARTYKPIITKDEYLKKISIAINQSKSAKSSLVALVKQEVDPDVLMELNEIIQEKLKR